VAPFVHDYSYWSSSADLMNGSPVEFLHDTPQADFCFNEKDPYWQMYKTMHLAEAQMDIEEEI